MILEQYIFSEIDWRQRVSQPSKLWRTKACRWRQFQRTSFDALRICILSSPLSAMKSGDTSRGKGLAAKNP